MQGTRELASFSYLLFFWGGGSELLEVICIHILAGWSVVGGWFPEGIAEKGRNQEKRILLALTVGI